MTPAALHASIDWQTWLQLFQLPASAAALPARTTCPCCHDGTMVIYADVVGYGQWAWCQDCGVAGNLLYLAGKLWRTNVDETVQRLQQHGVRLALSPNAVELYRTRIHRPTRTGQKFWAEAQQRLQRLGSDFRAKLLRLTHTLPAEPLELAERLGQICGTATCANVELLFNTGKGRRAKLFRGEGWTDTLVVPRWRLPGQLCGFSFIGRSWRMTQDRVDHMYDNDHGLAMAPQLLRSKERRRPQILATSRLGVYTRLQLRSVANDRRLLPLVHWSSAQPGVSAAWQMLREADIVLWETCVTPESLAVAYTLNCSVAISDIVKTMTAVRRPGGLLPHEAVSAALAKACPWYEAATKHLRQLDDEQLLKFLTALRMRNIEIAQLLASCGADIQKRAARLFGDAYNQRSIQLGRYLVTERDGSWYATSLGANADYAAGTLITNALLRIDRIVHRPRLNITLYQGRVLYRGQEISFCAERDEIERNPLEWIQRLLLEQRAGVMYFNPVWRRFITQISMQLHAPVLVRGADHVGWDHERGSLVLPHFEIQHNGNVRQHEGGFQPDVPGFALQPPDVPTVQDLEDLGDRHTRRALLTLIGSVAAGALAPLARVALPNLLLRGAGADELLVRIAQACGLTLLRPSRVSECSRHVDNQQAHAWPMAIDSTFCRSRAFTRWLTDRNGTDGIVTTTSDEVQTALHLTEQWYLVDVSRARRPPANAAVAAGRLLTAYLAHMLHAQILPVANVDWLETTLDELQLFVERIGGDTQSVGALTGEAGLLQTRDAAPLARSFVNTLLQLRERGLASINGDTRSPLKLLQTDETVVIPKTAYLATVNSAWDVPLASFSLSGALTAAGVLLDDDDDNWTVSTSWFTTTARRARRKSSSKTSE